MLKAWKKLSEEAFNFGYRQMLKRVYELPDGRTGEFFIINGGGVVCVLALTPENRVILAQQFRAGPEEVLLELPGGGMDINETPLEAARRELLEETGFEGDLEFAGTCLAGGYSTMVRHIFVATNCRKVQEPRHDEFEFIEVVEMALPEFREHLKGGQLTDVAAGYRGLEQLKLL